MKKFKALYKAMYDDLKDSEMMIKYACDIREENPEDKNLADELAKYASSRLNHFIDYLVSKDFVKNRIQLKELFTNRFNRFFSLINDGYKDIKKTCILKCYS